MQPESTASSPSIDAPKLMIVYQATDRLSAYKHNAHTHSKKQTRQIADSIKAFWLYESHSYRWRKHHHRRARPVARCSTLRHEAGAHDLP
jgi:hypothetical protein